MAGVNKVILVGHLGKDPEVRALDNGSKVARFTVATTESYKDRNTGERVDNTEWHNVTVWRALAEVAENYLKKGSLVYIEGKLQTRSYEQDGVTKYATDVVARDLTMLGKKGDNQGGQVNQSQAQQQAESYMNKPQAAAPQQQYAQPQAAPQAAPQQQYAQPQAAPQAAPQQQYAQPQAAPQSAPQQQYAQPQSAPQQESQVFQGGQDDDDLPF